MMDKPPIVTLVMNITFYVLLSILLILWFISIICRRYRTLTRNRLAVDPNLVGWPAHLERPHGLEKRVIDTFPKFVYLGSDQDMNTKSMMKMTGECAVCLGAFEEKESLRLLPTCGHVFHVDCVDTWLRMHASCPFCRANLLPAESRPIDEGLSRVPPQVEVVINVNDGRER